MIRDLKLAFFATMSAGKTTCINAMLGTELLHSANEATTATITTIQHNHVSKVLAYDDSSNLIYEASEIDANTIKKLNAIDYVEHISIQSNFCIMSNLTIIDTPGPNNSMNDNHANLAYKYLGNNNIDVGVYLINATQPFINDDFKYIKYIHQHMKGNNIIFVVNKIDEFDFEVDSFQIFLKKLKEYLSELGFTNPKIFILSAYHALILKKFSRKEILTRKERRVLLQLIDQHDDYKIQEYLSLSQEIVFMVKARNYFEFLGEDFADTETLNRVYKETGFPYFEEYIFQIIRNEILKVS